MQKQQWHWHSPNNAITHTTKAAILSLLKTDLRIGIFPTIFPRLVSTWVLQINLTWWIIFLRTRPSRFHREVLKRLQKQTEKKNSCRRMNFLLKAQYATLACSEQGLSERYFLFSTVIKPTAGKQQYITSIHHRPFQERASPCKCLLDPWTLRGNA